MRYRVILIQSEEGFAASVPDLPGVHTQGATESEALENVREAIADYFAALAETGVRVRQVDLEVA